VRPVICWALFKYHLHCVVQDHFSTVVNFVFSWRNTLVPRRVHLSRDDMVHHRDAVAEGISFSCYATCRYRHKFKVYSRSITPLVHFLTKLKFHPELCPLVHSRPVLGPHCGYSIENCFKKQRMIWLCLYYHRVWYYYVERYGRALNLCQCLQLCAADVCIIFSGTTLFEVCF